MRRNFLLVPGYPGTALIKEELDGFLAATIFDAAIMKNIRAFVLGLMVGVPAFLGMAQPVLAQNMFVAQVSVPQKDNDPQPKLKDVLPLVFPETKEDKVDAETLETELFAPIFVDNSHGIIHKSVSAEKAMPLETQNITGISTYFSRFHPGIDYRAKMGTPIRAILPGMVNEVGFQRGGYGRYVVLVHYTEGKTLFSLYAHLKDTKVAVGDEVETKDTIGIVGLTGRTTGPHLHFELHDTKTAINPIKFFADKSLAMVVKK